MDLCRGQENSPIQARIRKYFVSGLLSFIISLGMQAAGFGSRGWLLMKSATTRGTLNMYIGLWAGTYCLGNDCETKSIFEVDDPTGGVFSSSMTQFQVETSVALALLLIILVVHICSRCVPCQTGILQGAVFTVVALTTISGSLALMASGQFADHTLTAHNKMKENGLESPIKFPYSLLLTGLGGILACIMSFVTLFGVKPWKGDPERPPAYEMSA